MIITITLHLCIIEIDLGIIEAKRMLVLARVENSAREKIPEILGFVMIHVEN
jgi:hypothetical protein